MVIKGEEENDEVTEELLSEETYRSMKRYTHDWRNEISGMSTNEDESESEQDRYAIADQPKAVVTGPMDADEDAIVKRKASDTPECIDARGETKCRSDEERSDEDSSGRVAQIEYMAFGDDSIIERKTMSSHPNVEARGDVETQRAEARGDVETQRDERCDSGKRLGEERCDIHTQLNETAGFNDSKCETETRFTGTDEESRDMNTLVEFSSSDDDAAVFEYSQISNELAPRSFLCDITRDDFRIDQVSTGSLSLMDLEESESPNISEEDSGNNQITPWSPKAILCGAAEDPFDVVATESPFDERAIDGEDTELQQELRKANEGNPISTSAATQQDVILLLPDKPLTGMGVGEQAWKTATMEAARQDDISRNDQITPWSPKNILCGAAEAPVDTEDETAVGEAIDNKKVREEVQLAEELQKANEDDIPFSMSKMAQQEVALSLRDKPLIGIDMEERVWKAVTREAARREKAATPKTTVEGICDAVIDLLLISSPRQQPKVQADATSHSLDVKADPEQTLNGLKAALSKRPFSPISPRASKSTSRKSDLSQAVRDLCFVGDATKLERAEPTLLLETAVRGSEKVFKTESSVIDRPFDEEASIMLDVNQVVEANLEKKGKSYPSNDLVDLSGNVSVVPVSRTMSERHPVRTAAATEENRTPACGVWQVEEINELVCDLRVWVTRGTSQPTSEEQSVSISKEEDDKAQVDDTENSNKMRSLNNALRGAIHSPRRSYSAHKFRRNIETNNGTACDLCVRSSQIDPFESSLLAQIKVRTAASPSGQTDISLPFDEGQHENSMHSSGDAYNSDIEVVGAKASIMFEAGLFHFQALQLNGEFRYSIDHTLLAMVMPRNATLVIPSLVLLPLYPVLEAIVSVHNVQTPETTTFQQGFCHLNESFETMKEWIVLRGMCTSRSEVKQQRAKKSAGDSRVIEELKRTPLVETVVVCNTGKGPESKINATPETNANENGEKNTLVDNTADEQENTVSLLPVESRELYALPSDEEWMDKRVREVQECMITSPLGTTEIRNPFDECKTNVSNVSTEIQEGEGLSKVEGTAGVEKLAVGLESEDARILTVIQESVITSPVGTTEITTPFDAAKTTTIEKTDAQEGSISLEMQECETCEDTESAGNVELFALFQTSEESAKLPSTDPSNDSVWIAAWGAGSETEPLSPTNLNANPTDELEVHKNTVKTSPLNESGLLDSDGFEVSELGIVSSACPSTQLAKLYTDLISKHEDTMDAPKIRDPPNSQVQEPKKVLPSGDQSGRSVTSKSEVGKCSASPNMAKADGAEQEVVVPLNTELVPLLESATLHSTEPSNDSVRIAALAAGSGTDKGPLSPTNLNANPTDEIDVHKNMAKASPLDEPGLLDSDGFEVSELGVVSSVCPSTQLAKLDNNHSSKREDTFDAPTTCDPPKSEGQEPKKVLPSSDQHDRSVTSKSEVAESSASPDTTKTDGAEQEVVVPLDTELVPLFAPSDEMTARHPTREAESEATNGDTACEMTAEHPTPEAESDAANGDEKCLVS
jgi:hypothetical protein